MIFAATGTQMPFDRMIRTLDKWAAGHAGVRVVAQIGEGGYRPTALEAHVYLAPARFAELQAEAELIVSHAGMGAILSAGMLSKPLVILPRRHAFGEHRNDHQIATARRFEDRPGLHVAWDESLLGEFLDRRHDLAAAPELSPYATPELLSVIDGFISGGGER